MSLTDREFRAEVQRRLDALTEESVQLLALLEALDAYLLARDGATPAVPAPPPPDPIPPLADRAAVSPSYPPGQRAPRTPKDRGPHLYPDREPSSSTYSMGCRCRLCTDIVSTYQRNRKAQRLLEAKAEGSNPPQTKSTNEKREPDGERATPPPRLQPMTTAANTEIPTETSVTTNGRAASWRVDPGWRDCPLCMERRVPKEWTQRNDHCDPCEKSIRFRTAGIPPLSSDGFA